MKRSASLRVARVWPLAVALVGAVSPATSLAAAPPVDSVLPSATVAMVSIADAEALGDKWRATQIGKFTSDASLEPFVNQMRDQLIEKFGDIRGRLGMTLDDITSAAGGEVGVGMLYDGQERASVAVLIDTTDKETESAELIAQCEAALAKRGAEKSTLDHGGVTLTVLSLPKTEKRTTARDVVHFRQGELLAAVDSVVMAKQIVDLVAGGQGDALNGVKEFDATMSRCREAAGALKPDARWFVAPFRWDAARRSLDETAELADRKDTLAILKEQGFDAIRGVGGFVNLTVTAEQDFVHRTAVYAPPKPGAEGKPAKEKYDLGMRMAQLPNRRGMTAEPWAPRMIAGYTTVNVDILNAFDHVGSVFDAMSGYEGAFQHTLDSFEVDPYGPQIKVRDQLGRSARQPRHADDRLHAADHHRVRAVPHRA